MLRNYFLTAWRNFRMRKTYTLINIFGLAVGIATGLIIFLVIHYETTYDHFQSKRDRIFRVVQTSISRGNGDVTGHNGSVPLMLPLAFRSDFPQMEKVSAVWNIGGAQIHVPVPGKDMEDEKKVKENDGLYFVEPDLFDMFDYSWVTGNAKRLDEPNTAVINETLAKQFFGNSQNAMGRTIQMWSFRVPLQIVGVFKDLPSNTDLEVKMGASFATFKKINSNAFTDGSWQYVPWPSSCFVLLPGQTSASQFAIPLQQFVKKYFHPEVDGRYQKVELALQPLSDIHLNFNFGTYKGDALSKKELWSLGLIGFFLLLVACVNFINLATAQSVNRAKEIGVRKVLGSSKTDILKQFLNETAFITLVSVVLGFLLARVTLPFANTLIGKTLSLDVLEKPVILLFLLLLGIAVNFLAGFYPGMVLSGFRPIEAIKNKITSSTIGGLSVRRGLVVFQFVIAQFLIIGTIVVLKQMEFFRNQSMGFDKNAVALIELPSDSLDQTRYNYLKSQMQKIPGVESAAFCLDAPASFGSNKTSFYFDNDPLKKDFVVNLQFADTGYLRTFQISLLAGRIPFQTDTMRELLVNETLLKKLNLKSPDEIIGKSISFDRNIPLTVVGVMHDFNSKSLKEPVTPFVLATNIHAYNFIALRVNPSRMQATLQQMEKTFTGIYPTYIYDLTFLDDRIGWFYATEALVSQLFKAAAFLAIFISCLGLYSLVSFMAVQKTKEVGIRKVLGASVQSIVLLFSKEFTLLILLAFLIAGPLGYLLMQQWLNSFYYHIHIGWIVFALAILISLAIAWLTVSYKAIKAAFANPVKSLRSE